MKNDYIVKKYTLKGFKNDFYYKLNRVKDYEGYFKYFYKRTTLFVEVVMHRNEVVIEVKEGTEDVDAGISYVFSFDQMLKDIKEEIKKEKK